MLNLKKVRNNPKKNRGDNATDDQNHTIEETHPENQNPSSDESSN